MPRSLQHEGREDAVHATASASGTAATRAAVAAPDGPRPSRRRGGDGLLAALAATGAAVAVAVVVLTAVQADTPVSPEQGVTGWPDAVVGLVLLLPGLLLVRGRDRGCRVLGTVLALGGAGWLATGFSAVWFVEAVYRTPGRSGGGLAYHVGARYGSFLLLVLPAVLLLFPDGRLPRGRLGRLSAVVSLASTALLPVSLSLSLVPMPVLRARFDEIPRPEIAALDRFGPTLDGPFWPPVLDVAYVALPVSMIVPLAVVVVRHHRSRGRRRLQMRWLVWAGLVDALTMGAGSLLPQPWQLAALVVALVITVAAVVTAVSRYRLRDVDRLLPATVVAFLLAVGVVAVDLGVLAVAGAALPDRESALLAVAVVAVAYTPLRTRLWTAARRLARGSRDDPYGALATLADRLETAAAPREQLTALARTVASAFRLPYVRVEIERANGTGAQVEHGEPGGDLVELPVRYRGETIGRVVLGTAGAPPLPQRDQRLLGELLRQTAAAVRADALGASLQRTRVALVTAREEERRRLRRDLHDSLGPGLGAVTLRVETARALAGRDPDAADGVLERVTEDVGALLGDVRRLVNDLRPPALDELGLAGAVAELARRLSGDVAVTVTGDAGPAALPAAVEVAAYRIVAEALTNVVRHAGAARADVYLGRQEDTVVVTVADDGRGIGADVVAGVGTLSLRERAAELGGVTTVTCPDGRGTTVTARLPLSHDAEGVP